MQRYNTRRNKEQEIIEANEELDEVCYIYIRGEGRDSCLKMGINTNVVHYIRHINSNCWQ